jgi:hypothetical protein
MWQLAGSLITPWPQEFYSYAGLSIGYSWTLKSSGLTMDLSHRSGLKSS